MTNESQRLDQCIGSYRLIRLLGKSDYAEIYLGEHITTSAQAAIKVFDGRGNDAAKFLAQADLLTHLRHPHILRVFDSGMAGDTPFLVMDYAPKGTLRQRYPKGTRLPLVTIMQYVRQIADALQYIHRHQLIHRDIKPHNMLLGPNGEVLLSDFGIAIVSQSFNPASPAFRDFEGTVLYAAPEQLQGKPRRSSDLYSFGVVVYEWLCGEWPFTGTFEEVVHQHLFIPPPFFSEKGVEIAPATEKVVRKVLAKEPDQRFPSAADFAHDLEQAYKKTQISAITLPPSSRRQFMSPLPFAGEACIKQERSLKLG
ncbi:MAG: serine/threonine protein kinase [Chloroflexota bacterium]|nr:serine/threonine protein kinase [Chloroflexota bacterium]